MMWSCLLTFTSFLICVCSTKLRYRKYKHNSSFQQLTIPSEVSILPLFIDIHVLNSNLTIVGLPLCEVNAKAKPNLDESPWGVPPSRCQNITILIDFRPSFEPCLKALTCIYVYCDTSSPELKQSRKILQFVRRTQSGWRDATAISFLDLVYFFVVSNSGSVSLTKCGLWRQLPVAM